MISDKVILIFGLIIAYFVLSANCGDSSEEKTEIKTIVEEMQDFLTRLNELDEGLHIPESFKKLGKITKRIWSVGWHFARHIKNKESHFEYFKDAYEKFVDYSVECITQYLQQFDSLGRFIGTQDSRADFLTRYNTEFVKKMRLRGHQSTETEAMYKRLEEKLTELCNRIYTMVYAPPPAPIVIVAPSDHHHHSSSSSSHSHSHEKRHEVETEHEYHDKSHSDHSHGNGKLVAAAVGGAVVGALGAVAVEEMIHDSESEQEPPPPAPVEEVPPAPIEQEVEVSHHSESSSSSAAVEEDPGETGFGGEEEENGNVNVSE